MFLFLTNISRSLRNIRITFNYGEDVSFAPFVLFTLVLLLAEDDILLLLLTLDPAEPDILGFEGVAEEGLEVLTAALPFMMQASK